MHATEAADDLTSAVGAELEGEPEMKSMLAIVGWYAVMSIVTFVVFGLDKWMATGDGRRVPEKLLHALEALGGWPGALLGMRVAHHKSRKKSYLIVYWLIVTAHVGGWLLYWFWWRADG